MLFWLVFGWASNVLGIWVTSLIFDGFTYDDKVWVLAVAGLVLFLANAIIRPIVIILTLPAVILTLGILLLFINAFTLWIADKIVPPFEVSGFWTYLGSVIIIWLVNMIVYGIFKPEKHEAKRELTA
jgi:putative membrane protein